MNATQKALYDTQNMDFTDFTAGMDAKYLHKLELKHPSAGSGACPERVLDGAPPSRSAWRD